MNAGAAPVQHRLPLPRPATSGNTHRADQEWFAAWRTEHYRGAWANTSKGHLTCGNVVES